VDSVEGERSFGIMQTLWQAGFCAGSRLNIPRPLAYLPGFKLLIQETARGVPLLEHLGQGDSASPVRIRSAARWLARLHALPVPADGIPRYEADECAITRFAGQLGERVPDAAARVGDLAAGIWGRLKPLGSSALTMVHGDYHPENIFVTKGGATVIDFDGCGLSHPARDLGYFVAQMRATAHQSTGSPDAFNGEIRTFVDAYRAALRPGDPEAWTPAVTVFAARACLETLYYILCVVQDRRRDVLSTWLQDIERFLDARHVDEVVR
jgi:aminoglycoside/choline kinase family phosphotransferase